ncbi:MAG TPA: hypothetical protein VFS21_30980 [Roseiflexaceae bacterium]|nr:hypothetical protein [Roseiflexaceae bacterium]
MAPRRRSGRPGRRPGQRELEQGRPTQPRRARQALERRWRALSAVVGKRA